MVKIKIIPAQYGDCILISISDDTQINILIDGGLMKTYNDFL